MTTFRIALANLRYPTTPTESVSLAEEALAEAGARGAGIIAVPEWFVPGYRGLNKPVPPPDAAFLDSAWSSIAAAARKSSVAVVLGPERVVNVGAATGLLAARCKYA